MTLFNRCGVLLALALAGSGRCWAAPVPANLESCKELRKHGRRAEASACYETLSRSGDAYLRAEGFWGLEQYDQANEAFRLAVAQPGSKVCRIDGFYCRGSALYAVRVDNGAIDRSAITV